jgi:LPXTG-site transpeptidase (sortase) family protein
MNFRFASLLRLCLLTVLLAGAALQPQYPVYAAAQLTITPLTWNAVGLDSNNVNVGPNNFPVGARVCNTGDTTANNVSSAFNWEAADPTPAKDYINLRPGSNTSYTGYTLSPSQCVDFYYEVQVTRNSNAYDDTRQYYITATANTLGTISTPRPRELYVEHLISQNRNAVTDVKLDGTSTPAGGTMSLMVGNTYNIQLVGNTATQGYEQLESFINFPNTIFQVNSVTSTYSANAGTDTSATTKPYVDGCTWVNDPGSPNYRSCTGTGKYGGNITVTYNVTILSGAGTTQALNTLIYDFSGSSYHYNADFSTGVRYASIVGPASVEITKTFAPKAISPSGTSVLTFKLTNPTTETITGVNFTDSLQGGLKVASTSNVSYVGCGSGAFSPMLVADATSLSFSSGTIAPNSACTITVSVTADSVADYPNTTGSLFINTSVDTGNTASDTLKVSSASACLPGQTLATWTFPTGSSATAPAYTTKAGNVATALTSETVTNEAIETNASYGNPAPSWGGQGFTGGAYFQFQVDTSNYSNVTISFDHIQTTASWNVSTVTVSSSSDGSLFTSNGSDTLSATMGSSTFNTSAGSTYFRVSATGAQNVNSRLAIDNVTFSGCLVPAPAPTLSKSFLPDPIIKGATSTLTFTINNTAAGNVAQSGIAFTDVLPDGLSIADVTTSACNGTNNLITTASTRTISLTGGSLAAGASCTFNVTVTGAEEGAYENITGFLSSTQSGTSTSYATDTLTVIAPPDFEKSFSPSSILTGETSVLQFTISNPNQATTLTGIGFTDTLPSGVTAVDGSFSYCNGTLDVTGGNLLTFSGGSVVANSICSFSVTVTGAAIGTKNNTTSDISSTEGGNGTTASATLVVSDPQPLIGLLKQISTDNAIWIKYVGLVPTQDIYYKFTVTNDGETTLDNISVTDPDVNMGTCSPALPTSLAVGASASCVVGPISISSAPSPNPFVNTATAGTSTYAPGSEGTSSAQYGTKSLSLDKTADKSTYSAENEVITYSYLVTNSGGYPLLGPVTVTDDKVTVTCLAVTTVGDNDNYFDPGESLTCSATYTILAIDMTNGSVTNTAYASADGINSPNDSVTLNTAPNLGLTKSNGSTTVTAGGTTTYALTVSNTGNTASSGAITIVDVLPSGISVADGSLALSGANAADWSCNASSNVITCTSSTGIAAANGTSSFSFIANVSASASGTLINKAQVGGGGDPLTSTPDATSANTCTGTDAPTKGCAVDSDTAIAPNLSLAKSNGSSTVTAGGTTTYTLTVSNTGNVSTSGTITLVDVLPGGMSVADGAVTLGGANAADWSCGASSNVITCTNSTVIAGTNGTSVFNFTVDVSSSASGTLTNKAQVGGGGDPLTSTPDAISATACTGTDAPTKGCAVDSDTVTAPNLGLTKSDGVSTVTAGGTTTYLLTISNTGNIATSGTITVVDTLPGGMSITDGAVTLGGANAGNWACNALSNVITCTSIAVITGTNGTSVFSFPVNIDSGASGTLVNKAQVGGGGDPLTGTPDATSAGACTGTDAPTKGCAVDSDFANAPSLALTKSPTLDDTVVAPGGVVNAGDTITYTFSVENTGNVTITNIIVTDPLLPTLGCTIASLAPSANASCTPTNNVYTLTQADVDASSRANTATATGKDPDDNDVTDDDSQTTTLSQTPAHTTIKTETSTGPYTVGDTITYTIVVTNTGNVTLTGVAVTDNNAALGACSPVQPSSLAPTETMTCPASHPMTQADVDTGSYVNTATGDTDQTASNDSDVTVNFTQNPAINIAKTPSTQTVLSGGTANFTLTVTNAGNVTLTGVVVTDAQCTAGPTLTGGDTNSDSQMQIAETWTYSCSVSNVTADFTNTASVNTTQGATDSDSADVVVTGFQADLSLDKSVSNSTPLVATNIDFTITITNVGPDTATNVEVTDVLPGGFTYVSDSATQGTYDENTGVWDVGTLILNQTETLTITVTVNVTGTYINDAEITASDQVDPDSTPNNGSTNEDDDDSVTITPTQNNPNLSKSVSGSNQTFTTNPNVAIGEIVEYTVTVNIPPGILTNAQLVDTMERGLSFMTCTSITGSDPALTTDVAGSFAGACSSPTVDDAGGSTTVDVGRRVTFDLGTLTNASGSDQTLTFSYTAVVLDSAANVSGAALNNSAEWISDSGSLTPVTSNILIVEPDLSISKTANTTLASVGSEITITLTIQHTADSETNAYDTLVTDVLPAELDYVPATLECTSGAQDADVLCNYNAGTRTISAIWSNFALSGGNGRITFRVRVLSLPSTGISNIANVAWTSLPGNVSTPQNSNVFSTERDYDPASQIDVYGASDTLVLGVFNSTPATGFAPNVVTDLSDKQPVVYTQTGGLTVEIPSLGINIPIVGVPLKNGGWDVSWLGNQAGWLEGSAFPSWNGNSVLTSHVYGSNGLPGPFVGLNALKYGDKIVIHAYGQKYTFEVRINQVVEPNDASIFKHEEKSWLTLVTCKEYDAGTNTYKKRVVVRAVLISVER